MKCFAVGRHSLKRVTCRSWIHDPSCASLLFTSPHRKYALTSTSRRMNAHDTSDARDIDGRRGGSSKSQAYPLSGYYKLILNAQTSSRRHGPTDSALHRRGEDESTATTISEAQTPQEKMAIVFGTRLAGPGRQSRYNPGETPPESMWKTINGVPVPPRPEEPDNCCMSGCVHCVWDDFRDEIEEWAARVEQAKAKAGAEKGTSDMRAAPRSEVDSASQSMDDDGGGSEANWPTSPTQGDDLFAGIPVGIREFMKTEKRLRAKHQEEASA